MPSKKTNGRKRVRSPKPIPKSTSDPAPERYSRDQILDLLEDHFETVTEAYRKTQAYTELKTFFTELLTKDDKLEIDRCICVGLGSLAIGWIDIDECEYAPTECTSHGRPMSQFVAFNEWVRHIKETFPNIRVYFQDPIFSCIDIEFIESKGYEVIQRTAAFGLLTNETFLFAPCVEFDLTFDLLTVKEPAIHIGSDIEYLLGDFERLQRAFGREFKEFDWDIYLSRPVRSLPKFELSDWMELNTINYARWIEGLSEMDKATNTSSSCSDCLYRIIVGLSSPEERRRSSSHKLVEPAERVIHGLQNLKPVQQTKAELGSN